VHVDTLCNHQLGDVSHHAALFISESIMTLERRSGVLRPNVRVSSCLFDQAVAKLRACWFCETVFRFSVSVSYQYIVCG
jgi:hypothetical protein